MHGYKYNLIFIVYMTTRIHFTAEILNTDNIINNLENDKNYYYDGVYNYSLFEKENFSYENSIKNRIIYLMIYYKSKWLLNYYKVLF